MGDRIVSPLLAREYLAVAAEPSRDASVWHKAPRAQGHAALPQGGTGGRLALRGQRLFRTAASPPLTLTDADPCSRV
jgi:hypothetical protein